MPEAAYYVIFYSCMLIVAALGLFLKFIPVDVGISMIAFVMGHGTGLFAPVPRAPSSNEKTGEK